MRWILIKEMAEEKEARLVAVMPGAGPGRALGIPSSRRTKVPLATMFSCSSPMLSW